MNLSFCKNKGMVLLFVLVISESSHDTNKLIHIIYSCVYNINLLK